MIASRDLKLPPRIDFLYVEQEVVADDTPAVEAVLRADQVRWDLMEEEKLLMQAVDAGDESEEKITRLQQVVDALTNMGADAAESKARRILFGLGFTVEMQTKPTKMFSGGWRMRISVRFPRLLEACEYDTTNSFSNALIPSLRFLFLSSPVLCLSSRPCSC
jgi:ATP-binding cassette, subfamily F, member 1